MSYLVKVFNEWGLLGRRRTLLQVSYLVKVFNEWGLLGRRRTLLHVSYLVKVFNEWGLLGRRRTHLRVSYLVKVFNEWGLLGRRRTRRRIVFIVTGNLPQCRVRSTCDSSSFLVPLTARTPPFVDEKSVKSPEISTRSLDLAAWVLPGKINAMKNCVHCNWGLATLSGEVNVRFIVLLSPFDRKNPNPRSSHLKYLLDLSIWWRGCLPSPSKERPESPRKMTESKIIQRMNRIRTKIGFICAHGDVRRHTVQRHKSGVFQNLDSAFPPTLTVEGKAREPKKDDRE